MNIVALKTGPRAPADLSKSLRELADAIDRGEITGLVAACVRGQEYEFVYGASINESLTLATLLQARTIERFKV